MHLWQKVLCALFALVVANSNSVSGDDLPALELVPSQNATSVGNYLFFGNPETPLTKDNLQTIIPKLQRGNATTNQFGSASKPILILLKVKNSGTERGRWVYSTGRGSLLSVTLFEIDKNGRFTEHLSSDNPSSLGTNLRQFHSFSFNVELDAGEEKTLGINFQPTNSTWLPITLRSEQAHYNDIISKAFVTMGSVIGIIILILFNGMLYATTGQRVFLLIIVAEVGLTLQILHQTGYTTIYYFIDHREIGRSAGEIFKCIFVLGMAQFARRFLETAETMQRYDFFLKLLIWATWITLTLLLLYPLFKIDLLIILYYMAWLLTAVTAIYIPFIALAAVRRKGHLYTPLLIGWTSLALYILYTFLASFGFMPGFAGQWYWIAPVSLFDGLCMTFSLALSIGYMHRNSLQTQVALNESLSERLSISEKAQQLAEERALAVSNLEDQSALMHSASHDSKQVILSLNIINDVLARSKADGLPEQIKHMLSAAVGHLRDIVATTMSPASQGTAHLSCPALSCGSVEDLLSPLTKRYAPLARKKGVSVTLETKQNTSIISDFALLNRILSNLMSNAVKFTEQGNITLRSHETAEYTAISIRDTGPGMSAEQIQASLADDNLRPREKLEIEGSGLGLKSCAKMLRSLSGDLEIIANENGTLVTAYLPKVSTKAGISPNVIEIAIDQMNSEKQKDLSTYRADDNSILVIRTADQSIAMREKLHQVADFIVYSNCPDEALTHPAITLAAETLLPKT